ncbi:MAG: BamA/TamA family outer membrane protein [Alphaproteobacteria bacterium]|nr:BamA/TamA family outer membrane protein [Alphaproteobacteria bacterium]
MIGALPTLARVLTCLALVSLLGCVSVRRRSDTTLVRKIRVRGLGGLPLGERSRYALRQELVQGRSGPLLLTWPFNTFTQPAAYRPHMRKSDAQRVETWLGHRGWFAAEATIDAKRVRRERRHKAGVVDLVVRIDRGRRTRWDGRPTLVGELPPTLPEGLALAGMQVRRRRGARLGDALAGQDWLVRSLADRGYAVPRVDMDLRVDVGTRRASVVYTVEPGTLAVFGPVESGVRAPRATVERIARLPEGETFNATRVREARAALLGTGAYDHAVVEVEARDGLAIPRIEGEEGRPRHVAVGARIGVMGGILGPQLTAGWSHDDLAGRLHRFYIDGNVGVVFREGDQTLVPVFGGRVGATLRNVRGTDVEPSISAEQILFQYALPRLDVRAAVPVRRPLSRTATLEVGPSLRLTRLGLDASTPLWIAVLGRDAVRAYGVVGLGGTLTLDRTTPDVDRREGTHIRLGLDGRLTSTGVPLAEAGADLRVYRAPATTLLGRPVQLSARAEVRGLLAPRDVPWPERLFLGGASDFRGFRTAQVGVYDAVCAGSPFVGFDPDGEFDRFYIPRGGRARALVGGEVELQHLGFQELSGALFAEAGWLDTAGVRGTVGAGVRYATGLGPFRFDVSLRPLAPEDLGPGLGGPGEMYGCEALLPRRRAFDLLSEIQRYEPLGRRPALNVFITVGRPF